MQTWKEKIEQVDANRESDCYQFDSGQSDIVESQESQKSEQS